MEQNIFCALSIEKYGKSDCMIVRDEDNDNDIIRRDSWNLMRLHSDMSRNEMNDIKWSSFSVRPIDICSR
jgi:hypothetical protein